MKHTHVSAGLALIALTSFVSADQKGGPVVPLQVTIKTGC